MQDESIANKYFFETNGKIERWPKIPIKERNIGKSGIRHRAPIAPQGRHSNPSRKFSLKFRRTKRSNSSNGVNGFKKQQPILHGIATTQCQP
mmetsp:Transcript_12495/g.14402  ORF Transcript_12495/g.14402 Transcript_12495/m.14402 type:complete len:92 (-) Transcript_12495:651-926(-)